jgi:hypothetical protein
MRTHLIRLRSGAGVARNSIATPHPRNTLHAVEQIAAALGTPLQAKLRLGAANDAHEREADAVAERVLRLPDGVGPAGGERVQRKCAQCDEEEALRREPADAETEEMREEEREDEALRTQAATSQAVAGPLAADTAARIKSQRGRGQPLPGGERAFFEPRFGNDLSQVRVHDGAEAAGLNQGLNARAFTVGDDVFFGRGEYRPGSPQGRHLLAHELTHVLQQRQGGAATVRRWNVGPAPAPHGWDEVTDADHLRRLAEAEVIVEQVVNNRRCQTFFTDNCTNGGGATVLRDTFDNANVYLRPFDDNVFGEGEFGGNNLAFNLRAFRIGRFMMASSLLHEMFHNCDATGAGTGRAAELNAENAVERCRLHTPWIDTVAPRTATVGAQVTIRGWNFGPQQGTSDAVEIGGVTANVIRWEFMAGTSSRVEIVAEVPAGAASGGLVVINNAVRSNRARLTVT